MLMYFGDPCVVTATILRTLRSTRRQAVCSFGEFPGDSARPDTVEPSLEHCWLPRPPCRVDEHEGVAPHEVLGMGCNRWVDPWIEVYGVLVGAQFRSEALAVQIGEAHLGTRCFEAGDDSIARSRNE